MLVGSRHVGDRLRNELGEKRIHAGDWAIQVDWMLNGVSV